jgi:MraZ protein
MKWNRVGRVGIQVGDRAAEVGPPSRHDGGAESEVFLGEYQHTLDAKGRVSLPRKFRDETGSPVVVCKGLDKCLYVFTAEGYREFLDGLLEASGFDPNGRAVRRFFTAGAVSVDVDGAGRVNLTPALREHAGLGKDVIVAGVGDHIEIWDAGAWSAYEEANAKTIEDAAEELARQGIL